MITVAELRTKAENRLRDVLRGLILGEPVFPLQIRIKLPPTTSPLADLRASYEAIRSQSRERLPHGYSVEWETTQTRSYGPNDVPQRLYFASAEDFFGYLGEQAAAANILANARLIEVAFPGTTAWTAHNIALLGEPAEVWRNAIVVAAYLREHPLPGVFARQLPIAVPTKFVEKNSALLQALVEKVAPGSLSTEGDSFEDCAGLLTKESMIELSLLDPAILPALPMRRFTASVDELATAGEFFAACRNVLIVENHITFLTLPQLEGTLAIMGQGYAVHRLARLPWLASKRLVYWGDIDADGFRILAGLRQYHPQAQSIMMDQATFERHSDYHETLKIAGEQDADATMPLTEAERALFKQVRDKGLRLEQEKIPMSEATEALRGAIL